jgi:hypothetical protein
VKIATTANYIKSVETRWSPTTPYLDRAYSIDYAPISRSICGLISIDLQIATIAGMSGWIGAGIDRSQSYSKGYHIDNLTQ